MMCCFVEAMLEVTQAHILQVHEQEPVQESQLPRVLQLISYII